MADTTTVCLWAKDSKQKDGYGFRGQAPEPCKPGAAFVCRPCLDAFANDDNRPEGD
jgi:hypothetical protein